MPIPWMSPQAQAGKRLRVSIPLLDRHQELPRTRWTFSSGNSMERCNERRMKSCKIHFILYLSNRGIFALLIRLLYNFRCRHGSNGCCVHCSPLEPFDEVYMKEQNLKHLSFHSHLRKLTAGVDRYKTFFPLFIPYVTQD